VVVAAVGEPPSIFPPLTVETVGRDIGDLMYEKLADLSPHRATIDPGAYTPALATRWEQVDSVTWRFTLRDGARWHDGRPVTAEDVRFSFDVFRDSVVDAPPRGQLASIVSVEPADSNTVIIRFSHPYSEQLYDATFHVRIVPRHVWEPAGERAGWAEDTTSARLIGSGPYRFSSWQRGQSLTLVADTASSTPADIRRILAVHRRSPGRSQPVAEP
jgi:peptide/nickel transport system substrate-binding protein